MLQLTFDLWSPDGASIPTHWYRMKAVDAAAELGEWRVLAHPHHVWLLCSGDRTLCISGQWRWWRGATTWREALVFVLVSRAQRS